jgi:hypothetical protein
MVLAAALQTLGYYTMQTNVLVSLVFLPEVQSITCNRSSKSRAASFFISEAFVAKRLIVLEPNVGISRNLAIKKKLLLGGS